MLDEKTEEDMIIENLVLEGGQQFEDQEFMPIRQSLYEIESIAPQYDEDICHFITWCRPHEIHESPEYFAQPATTVRVIQGSLPDNVFLGVLVAVAVFPGCDLLENIFASKPDDFKAHGLFTCRFYVEGEWVEVVTDSKIPCVRDQITGQYLPVYARTARDSEVWVQFVEKAYARAVGNYESIQKTKVPEALLQLTGGSVQQVSLTSETGEDMKDSWQTMFSHMNNDTLILAVPALDYDPTDHELSSHEEKDGEDGEDGDKDREFVQGNLYSIVSCKEIGGFELVLLHNPWTEQSPWRGSWSDVSNDWETYPELLVEIESDPLVRWRRNDPKGYFWMSFKSFRKRFNTVYFCKIFPNNKFSYYCMRGEWAGSEAGGPMVTIRDRDTVVKAANESRFTALRKNVAAEVIDGDSSWFNNPQFRVRCTVPTTVYASLVPLRGAGQEKESGADLSAPIGCMSIVSYSKTIGNPHLWDGSACDVCSTEFINGAGRLKGQETSIWKQQIQPHLNYQIVPATLRRGILGSFILRVFSRHPIVVEAVDKLFSSTLSGAWTKESSGGALRISVEGKVKENPKWCQSPQYHFALNNLFGKDELHLKIVLRRTDLNPTLKAAPAANLNDEPNIGLTVCKAEYFYDAEEVAIRNKGKSLMKGKPRENAMGELIESKGSYLKKKSSLNLLDPEEALSKRDSILLKKKKVLRKTSLITAGPLADAEYVLESTISSKKEACIYYSKLPRSFVPTGFVIVPSFADPGVRGKFDLEVYCSEKFELSLIPDSESRVLAGTWTEALSGGSHLNPNWKKNPRYSLKLKATSKSQLGPNGEEREYSVRIALCKHGSSWRRKERKDTVGSMISFYVFVSRNNDLIELYSAPFVPTLEVCTEDDFKLPPLRKGEEYVIMPVTNAPDVHGNFILSVMCEQEFLFTAAREKGPGGGSKAARGTSGINNSSL